MHVEQWLSLMWQWFICYVSYSFLSLHLRKGWRVHREWKAGKDIWIGCVLLRKGQIRGRKAIVVNHLLWIILK